MTLTNVELYEALKPTVGEAAARMMAEVIPTARDIATKNDVDGVRSDLTREIESVRTDLTREIESVRTDLTREIEVLRGETRTGFAELNGRIHAEGTRTIKWLLGFFVPVWAGTWGTVIAVLMKA